MNLLFYSIPLLNNGLASELCLLLQQKQRGLPESYIESEIYSKTFQTSIENAKQSLQKLVSMKQKCLFQTLQQIKQDVKMLICHEETTMPHVCSQKARPFCENRPNQSRSIEK